jgi:hypothetical protein
LGSLVFVSSRKGKEKWRHVSENDKTYGLFPRAPEIPSLWFFLGRALLFAPVPAFGFAALSGAGDASGEVAVGAGDGGLSAGGCWRDCAE